MPGFLEVSKAVGALDWSGAPKGTKQGSGEEGGAHPAAAVLN